MGKPGLTWRKLNLLPVKIDSDTKKQKYRHGSNTFPPPFPRLSVSPVPLPMRWGGQRGRSSAVLSFSHYCSALVWAPCWLQSFGRKICSGKGCPCAAVPSGHIHLLQPGSFPGCGGGYLLWHLEHFLPLLLRPCCSLCCFSLLFVPSSSLWHFLPFLNSAFLEVLPVSLRGSAGSRCGSVGATWDRAVPGLFPQGPPLQPPCCQHLARYTQYSRIYKSCSSWRRKHCADLRFTEMWSLASL